MTTRLAGEGHLLPPLQPGERQRRREPRGDRAATGPPTSGRRSGSATASSTSSPASSTSDGGEARSSRARRSTTETVIFPRYHQLDAVRRLEAAARAEGPGHNYLVQHSAGCGKSNTIAWLAHRLAELHTGRRAGLRLGRRHHRPARPRQAAPGHHLPVRAQAGRRREDRRELDPARGGPRARATPIIITTLQKFPFVARRRSATLPEPRLRRHRGRGPQLPDRRGGARR